MTQQHQDIGRRLRSLREDLEISPETFCQKTNVSVADLAAYEVGEKDFSFSFFQNAATILGVDVMDLISGDTPRLSQWTIVRGGEGYAVDRLEAHTYQHLAFAFKDKKAEPFLVESQPSHLPPQYHTHEGQEFNYIVEGTMRLFIADKTFDLVPGDSVYFNATVPHAQQALGHTLKFVAVVMP